jgi:hypothetical protein
MAASRHRRVVRVAARGAAWDSLVSSVPSKDLNDMSRSGRRSGHGRAAGSVISRIDQAFADIPEVRLTILNGGDYRRASGPGASAEPGLYQGGQLGEVAPGQVGQRAVEVRLYGLNRVELVCRTAAQAHSFTTTSDPGRERRPAFDGATRGSTGPRRRCFR